MTEMVSDERLETKILLPSRDAVIPTGLFPTAMVFSTALVAVLMAVTLLEY